MSEPQQGGWHHRPECRGAPVKAGTPLHRLLELAAEGAAKALAAEPPLDDPPPGEPPGIIAPPKQPPTEGS